MTKERQPPQEHVAGVKSGRSGLTFITKGPGGGRVNSDKSVQGSYVYLNFSGKTADKTPRIVKDA